MRVFRVGSGVSPVNMSRVSPLESKDEDMNVVGFTAQAIDLLSTGSGGTGSAVGSGSSLPQNWIGTGSGLPSLCLSVCF